MYKINLEPNPIQSVEIKVQINDLALYKGNSQSWMDEEMDYKVLIGGSSKTEDLQTARFTVSE